MHTEYLCMPGMVLGAWIQKEKILCLNSVQWGDKQISRQGQCNLTKAIRGYALVARGAQSKSTGPQHIPRSREIPLWRWIKGGFLRNPLKGCLTLGSSQKGGSKIRAYVQVVYFEV